jgi:hypothetical protein
MEDTLSRAGGVLPPFAEDEDATSASSTAVAVLGEIVERGGAAGAAAATASAAAPPVSLSRATERGFPATFRRAVDALPPAAGPRGVSLFRRHMAAAGAGAAVPPAAAAAPTRPSAIAGPLTCADASDRAALAAAVGLSVGELDALEAEASASVRAMSAHETEGALHEARALIGDAAYDALRARPAAAALAQPLPAPLLPPQPKVESRHYDLSSIRTEEDLDAAARALLPPSELAKLAWTGIQRGHEAGGAAGAAAQQPRGAGREQRRRRQCAASKAARA